MIIFKRKTTNFRLVQNRTFRFVIRTYYAGEHKFFNMNLPELVKTSDGSDTLYLSEIDEHFHSTHGAIQESNHVFIVAGMRTCKKQSLTIFEVGFGTGLNAYLTILEAITKGIIIRYITVEKYPLPKGIWESLNYPHLIENENSRFFEDIHEAPWNQEVNISHFFSILKLSADLTNLVLSTLPIFDLIYYDAFSPEKQPELWETSVFKQLADHCNPEAKIVTYCAKGAVRRSLKEAGFVPERIPGPPGKREMLRGTKSK